jgi:3-oxoadipate enol-lactonase
MTAEMALAHALSGGVRIAFEERGSGPPLILIHGLGYGRWGWRPVLPSLAEQRRVIVFDNRGIGSSDVPPGPYSVRAMAEDAVAVLDAAAVDRADVVGTSLGGMVAQVIATDFADRVDRLVLASTTPGSPHAVPFPSATVRLLAEAPSLDPLVALRRFVENALAPDAPEALVEEIYALRLANPPDPAGWQAQAAASGAFDGYGRLVEITAPTLVLHGDADRVVDCGNASLLAGRISDARLELFAGCGHLFFWEQPQRFASVVGEFLA